MSQPSDFYNLFKRPSASPTSAAGSPLFSAHATPEAPIDIVQAFKGVSIDTVVDTATRRFLFYRLSSIDTTQGTPLITAGSSLAVASLMVQADSANTGIVIVGSRAAINANAGMELAPGQGFIAEEEEKDTGLRSWIVNLFRLVVTTPSIPKFKRAVIDASDFAVFSSTSAQAVRVGLGLVLEDFN